MRLVDADKFEVVTFQNKSPEFAAGVQWILEQLDATETFDINKHDEQVRLDERKNIVNMLNILLNS